MLQKRHVSVLARNKTPRKKITEDRLSGVVPAFNMGISSTSESLSSSWRSSAPVIMISGVWDLERDFFVRELDEVFGVREVQCPPPPELGGAFFFLSLFRLFDSSPWNVFGDDFVIKKCYHNYRCQNFTIFFNFFFNFLENYFFFQTKWIHHNLLNLSLTFDKTIVTFQPLVCSVN